RLGPAARRENVDPVFAGAVKNDAALLRVELIERHVGGDAGVRRKGREHGLEQRRTKRGPKADGALSKRKLGIAEQGGRIGAGLRPQAFARSAPAERAVEREAVRCQPLEAAAALVAGVMLAVNLGAP